MSSDTWTTPHPHPRCGPYRALLLMVSLLGPFVLLIAATALAATAGAGSDGQGGSLSESIAALGEFAIWAGGSLAFAAMAPRTGYRMVDALVVAFVPVVGWIWYITVMWRVTSLPHRYWPEAGIPVLAPTPIRRASMGPAPHA